MAHLMLLALKVAPNVFDLSSGQAYVSIRDQIVRAQLMIRDLRKADPRAKHLLVIGAGVAGIAAAVAAARQGLRVDVIERGSEPFCLQAKARHRYVGPFMYEWPSHFHADQSYPPAAHLGWGAPGAAGTPRWNAARPVTGTRLARYLRYWLGREMKQIAAGGGSGRIAVWTGADPNEVKQRMKAFTRLVAFRAQRGKGASAAVLMRGGGSLLFRNVLDWRSKATSNLNLTPDYIVLGAGLGEERTTLEEPPNASYAKGPAFWDPDQLRSPVTANQCVGVFGGGDGALQDVLRALTSHEHPLRMIDALRENLQVASLIDAQHESLSTLEQQTRLMLTWGGAASVRQLDLTCAQIAKWLAAHHQVRAAVAEQIRPGSGCVQHFLREDHFTKAYLLNRFLVHLIIECMQPSFGQPLLWSGKVRFECHMQVVAASRPPPAGSKRFLIELKPESGMAPIMKLGAAAIPKRGIQLPFDQIAIRHGAKPGSAAGSQLISVSKRIQASRVALSPIPLPYLVSS